MGSINGVASEEMNTKKEENDVVQEEIQMGVERKDSEQGSGDVSGSGDAGDKKVKDGFGGDGNENGNENENENTEGIEGSRNDNDASLTPAAVQSGDENVNDNTSQRHLQNQQSQQTVGSNVNTTSEHHKEKHIPWYSIRRFDLIVS